MGGKEQSLLEAIRNGDSTSAIKILNKSISGKKQLHHYQQPYPNGSNNGGSNLGHELQQSSQPTSKQSLLFLFFNFIKFRNFSKLDIH